MATDTSVPGMLLAALKARKFTSGTNSVAKLFASDVQFEAWNNAGHWAAEDPVSAARIIEVWFTPGSGPSTVVWSAETANAKSATLEAEIHWIAPPDDQPRVLRQIYLMTLSKDRKIASMRVYCPGLHTEFPEVDVEKQRRQKGLAATPPKPQAAPRVAAKAG